MPNTEEAIKQVSIEELEGELQRTRLRGQYGRTLRNTVFTLIVVAAVAVLIATLWMPVLRIYGNSMTPTLSEGNIVVSLKGAHFDTGDLVSFYHGNRLLAKRVIAGPGDWVDIDDEGNVYVNGTQISEPYVSEKAKGDVSLKLPYQVPESRFFVLGDHRSTSTDSRNAAIGCISEEQVVGKIVFRVWPLVQFGGLD